MRIKAEQVRAKELLAGDLFSTADQSYWDLHSSMNPKSVGEKVFIRTEAETPIDQAEHVVYRITIER